MKNIWVYFSNSHSLSLKMRSDCSNPPIPTYSIDWALMSNQLLRDDIDRTIFG